MAATAAKGAATKRVAHPRVPRIVDAPVEAINLDALPEIEQETAHLFTLNGIDYHVVANPPASIGLRYLHMSRAQDQITAQGWLLETLLGEEAYTALMNYDRLTNQILEQVVGAVVKLTLGALEATNGPLGLG